MVFPARITAFAVLTLLLFGSRAAEAGDCIVTGSSPKLEFESVDWFFTIGSGQTCLRGLRSGAMLLESVTIRTPAKFGEASIRGYGFSYRAPEHFKGEDSFSVTMSGANRGIPGNSVINIDVLLR